MFLQALLALALLAANAGAATAAPASGDWVLHLLIDDQLGDHTTLQEVWLYHVVSIVSIPSDTLT